MSPGITFERVYHALKAQLGSGRYAAGDHLEPAIISNDLNSSITPVRDALHRLVGEGLVEAPRNDGFRTPFLTEAALRHLYRWNATLLDLAARAKGGRDNAEDHDIPDEMEQWADWEWLFLAIAGLPGNPEHVLAIGRLNERLRPARRIEAALIPDAHAETAELARHLTEGDMAQLRRALAAYHRKRERLASAIVERLHQPR